MSLPITHQPAPAGQADGAPPVNKVSMHTLMNVAQLSAHTPSDTTHPTGVASVLTPELAAMLLENNHSNRRLRERLVKTMVADILAGRWQENGESIIVAKSGRLLDGQHRCWAVLESNTPIRTMIVFGVADDYDVFKSIDSSVGGHRSVRDIMHIGGREVPPKVEAVSNMIGELTDGVDLSTRPLKAEYLATHIDEIAPWTEWARQISSLSPMVEHNHRRQRSIGDVTLATLAIHMARRGADPATLQEFFAGVVMELPAPVMRSLSDERLNMLKLINRRLKNGTVLNRATSSAMHRMLTEFALYIRSYNRYVRNESIGKVLAGSERFTYLSELPPVEKGPKR